MRNIKKYGVVMLSIALAFGAVVVLSTCSGHNEDSRSVVYEDMQAAFEQSGLRSSNIGIFSKTEQDGSVSYGECGSGVIIKRDGGLYYALTAAHVVSKENAQMLVFTVNTEMKTETTLPGTDFNVLSPETYDAMYPAEIEYVSGRDDLSGIRFVSDEELAVITMEEGDPEKGDRILCVGNPQNDWFAVSYGKVTSGIRKFGETHGFPSNAMKHTAYMQVGSSGGAAINEQMQLIGITPGGYYSFDGKSFKTGVLIPASEIKICLEEWVS